MKSILAIDDSKANLTVYEALINDNFSDHLFLKALSGEEGIKIAIKEQPDVILLDIVMPEMDGYQTCKKLKKDKRTKHIPIIMITAVKIDTQSRVKGLNSGADAFLSKPVDNNEFIAQINAMLRIKAAEDKLKDAFENTLQLSEKKFRSFVEQASEGIYLLEMKSPIPVNMPVEEQINLVYEGFITEANDSLAKMHGYSKADDVKGITLSEAHGGMNDPDNIKFLKSWIEAGYRIVGSESSEFDINRNKVWFSNNMIGYVENGYLLRAWSSQTDITERKKNEEELVKFKLCIERSFASIFITNTEGEIIFINPAFEQMYGFSSVEAIGKTPRILKSGTYSEDIYNYFWKTLLSKEAAAGELINKTKEGKLITVEGFNTSILDSKGEIYGYIGIHRDITERKTAEESLKLFRTLIDNSNDSIEVLDPATGRFLDVNDKGCKELGYSRDELLELSVFDIDPLVNPQSFAEIVKELRKSGTLTWEGLHNRKDGTSFPVEVNIRIVNLEKEYLVTVARDISLRKQNEESFLKLSRAVEQSPTSVIITDIKGIIEYVNPKLIEVTGYKNEEVLGKNPRIFSSGEKPKSEYKILWENILSGKEWGGEFHNKKKNGELYWEYAHISPIINSKGEITHIVAIKEDITLRKQKERELIIAKEKAEESDRLKSAFLTNMSHEIRTPMNGILGFTELLKEPDLSSDDQQNFLQVIHISGARMLNTISNIVDMSEIESGLIQVNINETNINEKIEFIYNFFKPEAENKNLQLSFKNGLQSKDAFIKTDNEKVYSILTNLVKNAIKFTKEGSIEFGYERKGEYLEFFVKDTGIGVPQKSKELIFERFRQGSESQSRGYEGSGLGLSIAKSYVEMLGGKIWVESDPDSYREGNGSSFYFTIPYNPVSEEKIVIENTFPEKDKEVQLKKLKILIVEDDEISYSLLTRMLQNISSEVLHAIRGIEAVEACRANPDLDLILMDIRMPKMDGNEATRQIRKFNKDVIIIAQTAFAFSGDKEKAIAAGCNSYIVKPINKTLLNELIKKHFVK